jgi:hypothetical protein
MYRKLDLIGKLRDCGVVGGTHLRRSFGRGTLGCSTRNLMQVDRADSKILVGIFLVHHRLCELPGAMDVVGAKLKHDATSIVCASFYAIGRQLAADLIAGRES